MALRFLLLLAFSCQISHAGVLKICEPFLHITKPALQKEILSWRPDYIGIGVYDYDLDRIFDERPPAEMRAAILPLLKSPETREALDRWLTRSFAKKARAFALSGTPYTDQILVGAGPHTLEFLLAQGSKPGKHSVVVERDKVGSTFYRRHFFLNTNQSSHLNNIPGAYFQVSDFNKNPDAPLAHDLGFIIRLNMRATGAIVLEDHEYKHSGIELYNGIPRVVVTLEKLNQNKTFRLLTDQIGIGTGLDRVNLDSLDVQNAPQIREWLARSSRASSFAYTGGLMTGSTFLRLLFESPFPQDRPTKVAIIGSKHTTFTVLEGLAGSIAPTTRIKVYGVSKESQGSFDAMVTPQKGSAEFKAMISNRYHQHGLQEIWDSGLVRVESEPAYLITPLPQSKFAVITPTGNSETFDWVIVSTGADRTNGLWSKVVQDLRETYPSLLESDVLSSDSTNREVMGAVLLSSTGRARRIHAFAYGPATQLPLSEQEATNGPVGNPDALFVTLPKTSQMGEYIRDRPLW